jgi:ubiquinone/menaquinone biosynthesis C-methylase UbiE
MNRPPMTDSGGLPDDPVSIRAALYSAQAQEYACLWSPVIRPMGRHLLHALPLADATQILDIGTGGGALVPDICGLAPNAAVIGLDRAEGMLRVAQAACGIPLAVMDAQRLAVQTASMDVAVLIFVLFLLPDPLRGLMEVARVLRPGGAVGITTWGANPDFPASAVWDEELEAHKAAPDPMYAREDQREMMDTPQKLDALLKQAGFVSSHSWTERFEHRWTPEAFFALRVGFGPHQRRLAALAPDARSACLSRIRERLACLGSEDFVYRPEVVFALAHRGPE